MLTSLAFLSGIVGVQNLPELPSIWLLCVLLIGIAFLAYKHYKPFMWLLIGIVWASAYGYFRLSQQLPAEQQNIDIAIQGYISSIPELEQHRASFDFVVNQPEQHFPGKLKLNWYAPPQDLAAGQFWQMTVRLKRPHGHSNPGSFDYEAWLFANHIDATGYVRPKPAPQQLEKQLSMSAFFASCRQIIINRLDAALANNPQLGLIKALTIGVQDGISAEQWQIFRSTGTTHLIVISGSHISLIAGLVYLMVRRAWAMTGILQIAPQRLAALVAWLAGLFYSGLAGYSLPTLRAVIMLSVALAAIAWQRHTSAMQVLMLALMAVLWFDPLAVISIGFWLSFIAVALLIYVSAGRLGRSGYWWETTLAQLASFIGLSPLLIIFFQQVSIISPIANWLAVPLIGVIIVPLALLAVIMLFIIPSVGIWLLTLTGYLLQGLWWLLCKLAELPIASIHCLQPPWYAGVLAGVGVLLILAPRGFPARHLSLFLFLPLIFVKKVQPAEDSIWLTLLDVGQGLSVVVQTHDHNLIFDTGSKFSQDSDMALSVLLPFLRYQGIEHIDTLIISHGDNDHSGGAESLLAAMTVDQTLSSVEPWAVGDKHDYCRAGQVWQWQQVQLQILSPPAYQYFIKENNNSCVLKISHANISFLLTGDIEQIAEDYLVAEYANQLKSTVLIAPHHGSKSSSSLAFLQQVQPELILIPSGYQNRFHFPNTEVLQRYQQLGIHWLNTAEQGAISVHSNGHDLHISQQRQQNKHYWQLD